MGKAETDLSVLYSAAFLRPKFPNYGSINGGRGRGSTWLRPLFVGNALYVAFSIYVDSLA